MIELSRFQNLRPPEWLSDEQVQQAGLSLYPDGKLSALALGLAAASDPGAHATAMARHRDHQNDRLFTSTDQLSPVIRSFYDWLNFKARPISPDQLKRFVATLDAPDPPDLDDEWRRAADNLLLAIEANLLAKNYCVDFQLIIRIFHLIRRVLKESGGRYELAGDVTSELIALLLTLPVIVPIGGIFGRCRRKCSDRNPMEIPAPAEAAAADPEKRPTCNCICDETCRNPVHHCICVRPYIGDLFLIREDLARYEAGEIGDIENVLAGEMKVRRHRMLTRSEETLELDSETTSSDERDHGVTEKFNLQSEVKSTVEQKINLDAGVTASLKYGPSITVTPHANVTANLAKSESRSLARSHARDIVDRSVTKLQEKTRRLQISKTIREVEEHNKHSIKNDEAAAVHRSGLYFWVNKITHAQVMNYGRHMMFDMIVPEPAATFRALYTKKMTRDDERVEPRKPDITPDGVQRGTYGQLLAEHGIASTDELQPPDRKAAVQWSFSHNLGEPEAGNAIGFSSHEYKSPDIPKGYRATSLTFDVRASTGHPKSTNNKDEIAVSVNVGDFCIFRENLSEFKDGGDKDNQTWSASGSHAMNGEEGSITAALAGFSSVAFCVSGSLTVVAEPTEETIQKWQLSVFNTIMGEYVRKLEAYEMAKEARTGLFEVKGRNPFLNREIERNEIKRHVIAALMCGYFTGIGAMMEHVAPCGFPEIDFSKLEKDAPVIQFFEQVFEWEYLTYLFYHSMWARKCKWPELIDENSGDPLFDKFLTSGAARVQVPVRPGMDRIFVWFLATGQIWGATGQPPLPGDNEYVAMIQELKEARQGNYDERPGLVDAIAGNDVLALHDSVFHWDSVNSAVDLQAIGNDRDREILVNYDVYRIVRVEQAAPGDPAAWTITIDRPYEGPSASNMKHGVGAVFVGAPWEVVTPTQLVYLRNPTDALPTYPLA
jgi:hypothetical protein